MRKPLILPVKFVKKMFRRSFYSNVESTGTSYRRVTLTFPIERQRVFVTEAKRSDSTILKAWRHSR